MWHWDLHTKIHYQVDLNRPWKWLIVIKDLISTKKFKNKEDFSSPKGGKNTQHHTD